MWRDTSLTARISMSGPSVLVRPDHEERLTVFDRLAVLDQDLVQPPGARCLDRNRHVERVDGTQHLIERYALTHRQGAIGRLAGQAKEADPLSYHEDHGRSGRRQARL